MKSQTVFERRQKPSENNDGPSPNIAEKQLRPVHILLTLLGFGRVPSQHQCLAPMYRTYTLLVLLVIGFMPVRLIWMSNWAHMFDAQNATAISLISWSAQTFFAALSILYIHHRSHYQQLWEMVAEFNISDLLAKAGNQRQVTRTLTGLTVCGMSYLLVNWGNVLPLLGLGQSSFPNNIFFIPASNYILVPVIVLMVSVWIGHQIYCVTICYYATQIWVAFSVGFRRKGQSAERFHQIIEWGFIKNRQAAAITAQVDVTFHCYSLSQLALAVPTCIWQLYVVVVLAADTTTRLTLTIWTFGNFLQVIVVCSSAFITSAADAARKAFLDVYVDRVHIRRELHSQADQLIQLQTADTLLNCLRDQDVGVTMCDLALLNKGFFLTMISVICSYFFLLLQFADQRMETPSCNSNTTAITG